MRHFLSSDDQYFRKSDQLLIQFQWANKGRKITIARWIKMAISTCYRLKNKPPQALLRAHSTWAVATSWAESGHTSIEQICKAANWSNPSTFCKPNLDIVSNQDLSFWPQNLAPKTPHPPQKKTLSKLILIMPFVERCERKFKLHSLVIGFSCSSTTAWVFPSHFYSGSLGCTQGCFF